MRATLLGLMVVGLWACKQPAEATDGPSPCDDAKLQEVAGALDQVPADKRPLLALRMATELCPKPAGLAASLQALESAPPDMRAMLQAKAVQENPKAWAAGCKGGIKLLQTLATVAPDQRGPMLWKGCDLARFDFATAAEAGEGALVVPAVLYAPILQRSKVPKAVKRKLLRGMLGLK